jgi:hypothetical protein
MRSTSTETPPPLLIHFAEATTLFRERHRASALRIIGNGPPGTFVRFPGGFRVSLPTDQIVWADDADGHVQVALGGMQFAGMEDGRLAFLRVREIWPDDQLSPDRSHKMFLDPQWVALVVEQGRQVWPRR